MRSPSEEGRDNRTLLERGPLGSGGTSFAKGPHTEAGEPCWWSPVPKAAANARYAAGMSGIGLKRGVSRRKATDRTAWYLSLKPYWGKPTVRNFRGRLETRVMVGRGNRSAIERAESGNSRPKAAHASALPDKGDE